MNTLIIKCLAELMQERECVIVPEFGAFISNECPARLDYLAHRLTPPSKEFAFNAKLISDDGVFVSYLSEKQYVTTDDAIEELHDFAMQCLAVLEVEKELCLEGVGNLYYLNNKTITFVADANVNFSGDSFGLAAFTVQPIYRTDTYHEVKAVIEEEQKAKNTPMTVIEEVNEETPHQLTHANYRWYRTAAYSAAVATALLFLGWGAEKSDSKFASMNPFFSFSPNEFVVKNLTEKYNARETYVVERLRPRETDLSIFENKMELVDKHIEGEQVKPTEEVDYYSIIGASFNNFADAEKCVSKFKAMGFENAEALPISKNGNYRVEYEAVAGKEAAMARLEAIKEKYNKSAWLLIKK